jgi:YbbR domain-containing protein
MALQLLGSFALAMLFWSTLIVAQGEMIEKSVTVPVEYTASPPQLAMIGDRREEVRLHLAGAKSDLDGLSSSQLSVKIDLSKAVAGTQNMLITTDNIRLPRGVQLLDVAPPSVPVALAAITEQEVAVRPQLIGKLPKGLRLKSVVVTPETVRALAPPASGANKTPSVATTPVYLDSISESTTILGKIAAPPAVHPVEKRWPDVTLQITVEPAN